jgi:excinuclease ABC subunit A
LGLAAGIAVVDLVGTEEELIFSQNLACIRCGFSFAELSPRLFSFNNPYGACRYCHGLGYTMEIDPDLVLPDWSLSLAMGAVAPWNRSQNYYPQLLQAVAEKYRFSTTCPVAQLKDEHRRIILYGSKEPLRVQYVNR